MRWPEWLGVRERRWTKKPDEEVQPAKTVWDLLQLLIVPLVLALVALLFSASQASRDRAIADEARQDAVLQTYVTRLDELVLERRLKSSNGFSSVRDTATALTLTTLRRVDGRRKGEVVRILEDASLLEPDDPRIDLFDADLRGADLRDAILEDLSLRGADLRGAKFDGAIFEAADLSGTRLNDASFRRALALKTSFDGSVLSGASFANARLHEASFRQACLNGTSFYRGRFSSKIDFRGAEGRAVDFRRVRGLRSARIKYAKFRDAQLEGSDGRPARWGNTGTIPPGVVTARPCTDPRKKGFAEFLNGGVP